jgi:iron complex transport system permease protein
MGIVMYLSHAKGSFESANIILAGILWSSLANALLNLMLSIVSPNQLQTFFYWFLGSLAIVEWPSIFMIAPVVLVLSGVIFFLSWEMNALSVGEDVATGVGVSVIRTRMILYAGASLLTALVVSMAGTIGFIGLVVPHLARLLLGADNRTLVPAAALLGATFCVLSDLLARIMLAPAELPVGVVTAFVGVPVFAYFVRHRRKI